MKRIAILIIGFLLLSTVVNAQFTTNSYVRATNSEMTVKWAGTLDSLGGTDSSLTSAAFDIEDYDGGVTNFTIYYSLTSAGALTPNVSAILYASEDGGTYTATTDTLMNAITGESPVWTTSTITGRAGSYKLKIFSGSGGSAVTFDIRLRSPLKEAKVR